MRGRRCPHETLAFTFSLSHFLLSHFSSMPNTSGLRRKIWVAFILQMTAISFAAVLGVYAAATVTEDVLIKRILQHDATYYLDRLATTPDAEPPDTYFVRSYLERTGSDA